MNEYKRDEFFVKTATGMNLQVISKIPKDNRLGKAILLVHGSGVGWCYWDVPIRDYSIMNYLAEKGLDVYAVECRGYGKSTKPNGMEITARSISEDLRSVLIDIGERSKVSKVSLAGHSSGGTVLMVAGGMYSALIDRMVLIGTPYKKMNPQFLEYAQMVINMAREPGKDYVPNLHYQDIENRLDENEEDVVDWYKKTVQKQYGTIPGGLFPDILENPGIPHVPTLEVPTLIFNGSNEYVVDSEDAMALYRELGTPDKCLMIQPESYHLPFLEKRGHLGLQESILFWATKT